MKTKSIPVIIMLLAGFLACIYGIINHTEIITFVWTLLLVMIVFYVLGFVIKIVIDKNFKDMGKGHDGEETSQDDTETNADEQSDGENEN